MLLVLCRRSAVYRATFLFLPVLIVELGLLAPFASADHLWGEPRNDPHTRYHVILESLDKVREGEKRAVLAACFQEVSEFSETGERLSTEWDDLEDCYLSRTDQRFAEVLTDTNRMLGTTMRRLCASYTQYRDIGRFHDCYYNHIAAKKVFLHVVKHGSQKEREQCAARICGTVPKDRRQWSTDAQNQVIRDRHRKKTGILRGQSCFPEPPVVTDQTTDAKRWLTQLAEREDRESQRGALARRCLNATEPGDCYAIGTDRHLARLYDRMPTEVRSAASLYCRRHSKGDGNSYAVCMAEQFDSADSICGHLNQPQGTASPKSAVLGACASSSSLAGRGSLILDWQALFWCSLRPGESPKLWDPKIHDFPVEELSPIGAAEHLVRSRG